MTKSNFCGGKGLFQHIVIVYERMLLTGLLSLLSYTPRGGTTHTLIWACQHQSIAPTPTPPDLLTGQSYRACSQDSLSPFMSSSVELTKQTKTVV